MNLRKMENFLWNKTADNLFPKYEKNCKQINKSLNKIEKTKNNSKKKKILYFGLNKLAKFQFFK